MDNFVRAIRLISRLCGYFAAALIAVGVVIVCQMVFVRFVLNENTIWQTDFVTYSLVAATFIGSPYVLMTARSRERRRAAALPRPAQALLAGAVLDAAGDGVLRDDGRAHSQYWLEAWNQRWLSNTMWRVRLWIPYASMPIGLGILTLQYVVELYCLVTGREPPFGIAKERTA